MKTTIKNGTIVTSSGILHGDLRFEEGIITQVGGMVEPGNEEEIIDASELFLLPGGIDVHVHLDLPMFNTVSSDDHYTGTKAAAFGGTTTVIDFISQDSDKLVENIDHLRSKADPKVAVDYSLHMNITHLTDEVEEQIPDLVGNGITSVKVFTAYNNRLRLSDGEIFRVMCAARKNGILTMLHAENGDLIDLLVAEALTQGKTSPIWHARTRPAWGAVEAALRGASLAAISDAPLYIVHLNTAGEVDQVEYARNRGLKVMSETCPHYLFFTESDLEKPDGAKWICSPPLRTKADQERLWEGLKSGSIQVISTDHCPFFYDGTKSILYEGKQVHIPGKEMGVGNFTLIPNGLPGVGDRLPILWTSMVSSGEFTLSEFVGLTSTNPAKIFGLYPRKGEITTGADADIVLWDPGKRIKYGLDYAHHRTDYNLYEGWELRGFPVRVILRGNTIVDGNTWTGKPGLGKFIRRDTIYDVL